MANQMGMIIPINVRDRFTRLYLPSFSFYCLPYLEAVINPNSATKKVGLHFAPPTPNLKCVPTPLVR